MHLVLYGGVVYTWYSEYRNTTRYKRNHSSNYFFPECLWLSVGFILTRPSSIFQSIPQNNVVSRLHLYIFLSIPKNVFFITSRTRNGRMSITVQYITILSQTVGQCNVIVFTKINRFIKFQATNTKKTNYLFLFLRLAKSTFVL